MSDDLVERLRDYVLDDHERGCQGRCYDCSCGYDGKRDPLLEEAAAEIDRLRAALIAARPHLVAATCELLLHPPQPQEALDIVDAALNGEEGRT